jgi:hypothetical protein
MYTILRLCPRGDVRCYVTDNRRYAYLCYYFAEYYTSNGDFIALFEGTRMLTNNQDYRKW